MRFFGFSLGGAIPEEDAIFQYLNEPGKRSTLEALMQALQQQLREGEYLGDDQADLAPQAEQGS